MHISQFDYHLPEELIAQHPIEPRDASRLLVLNRQNQSISHHHFYDIPDFLSSGDVLVVNNTRVIPARIPAFKKDTGGKAEILLLKQLSDIRWQALVGGKGLNVGRTMKFDNSDLEAIIVSESDGAQRIIEFSKPINDQLSTLGQVPLPPYIKEQLNDAERYQTIYSRHQGSAAAPTAGLHFTPDLMLKLRDHGVQVAYCTLHVGLDTFQPVKVENIEEHIIHSEFATLDSTNAKIINDAKLAGNRVIAVGTTSARTLETSGILSAGGDPANPDEIGDICSWRPVIAFERETNLFIYPGYKWRVVDAMITNFHLPKSTLLMMISAFAGREFVLNAYNTAVKEQYRFFSFGDAMLIT